MKKLNVQKQVLDVALANRALWLSRADYRRLGQIHPDAEVTARIRDLRHYGLTVRHKVCADGVHRYHVVGRVKAGRTPWKDRRRA